MLPEQWSSILSGPAFMIGCEQYAFRREHSLGLVQSVGFSACEIVEGWDGYKDPEGTDRVLASLGIQMDGYLTPGHKGCSLSHFLLWKRIVDMDRTLEKRLFHIQDIVHTHIYTNI